MPFIDWNGNGRIDPEDIAISIALDDDDEVTPLPEIKPKPQAGCLASVMIFVGIVTLILLLF